MKITAVDTAVLRAGWRDWAFVRISTDEGVAGYADCTDSHGSLPAVLAAIGEMGAHLVGRDPRPVERLWIDLYRISRQSAGGVVGKALAAIENALMEVKARALGVPVYELLGGPVRDSVRLYWSHCGSTRIRSAEHLEGAAPLRRLADVAELGREVVGAGYGGFKTNLLMFDDEAEPWVLMQGFKGAGEAVDRDLTAADLGRIESLIATFREAVGADTEILLDVNMHFRADGVQRLARRLEPYGLGWLEVDLDDPGALAAIRTEVPMPVASCEKRQGMDGYRPFLDARAMDVALIDVRWNGIAQAKKVADLAALHDLNVAPHNHGSPLATLMAGHFCGLAANLRMMEYDVDDVPWRDDLVDPAPVVRDGRLVLPTGPGWGAELNEDLVRFDGARG